jgi:3-oxoacyl-[acyl-carrier-protein] synthase II
MGIVAPNGIGLDAFWQSLLAGRSGIGPITLFDPVGLKSRIAGEVKGFDPSDYIEPELRPKRMARHTQFAYAASLMALRDAGLEFQDLPSDGPIPVVVGVSTSALDIIESVFRDSGARGFGGVAATSLAASKPQAAADIIANRIGAYASATTVSTACPSGLDAVAAATAMIRSG